MLYPKDTMRIEAMFSSNLSTDGTNAHEASEWQMKKGCVQRFWELVVMTLFLWQNWLLIYVLKCCSSIDLEMLDSIRPWESWGTILN